MTTGSNQVSVATKLAAQTPEQVNSMVVSLAQQHDLSLTKQAVMKGGYDLPNGSHVPASYEWRWVATGDTAEKSLAMLERAQGSMTPAMQTQIAGWIAELSVISARRIDDHMSDELRLAAYSKRLAEYPADIARHAVLERRWKFFPTWAELAEVCDDLRHQRQSMIDAIKREAERLRREEAISKERQGRNSDMTDDEAKEQRKRAADEILGKFGFRNVMKDVE